MKFEKSHHLRRAMYKVVSDVQIQAFDKNWTSSKFLNVGVIARYSPWRRTAIEFNISGFMHHMKTPQSFM